MACSGEHERGNVTSAETDCVTGACVHKECVTCGDLYQVHVTWCTGEKIER